MKMQLLTWNNAKPTPGPDTRPASSMVVGAGCRGENPRLRRREKNVLDFPFYRSGIYTHNSVVGVMRIFHQPTSSVPQSSLAGTGTWFNIVRIRFRQRVWVPPHRVD